MTTERDGRPSSELTSTSTADRALTPAEWPTRSPSTPPPATGSTRFEAEEVARRQERVSAWNFAFAAPNLDVGLTGGGHVSSAALRWTHPLISHHTVSRRGGGALF